MGNISSKTIDNLPSNTIAVNKDATNGIHNKLTQSQSQTQLRLDSGKAGRQSWSSQSVRLHSVASKSWCNISTRSEKLQSTSLGSLSFKNSRKGSWPIPQTESLFLPHFKIYEGDIERQYTIVGLLERGAYGKVYEIIEKDTKEKFALKILSKAKIINEGSIRQIKDEVDIQTLCGHHPFIVQCHSFWQNRINIYLLAELIPRGELFKAITKFTYELVRLYVAELAIALDFLHNAGVIYRDLKPENILVDADYHLKITDFGFSKWLKIGNRTNTICGTTKYMAPEIFRGEYYGHAVDWWALGIVACLMFTNQMRLCAANDLADEFIRRRLTVNYDFE